MSKMLQNGIISSFLSNQAWQTGLARQTGPVGQYWIVGQSRLVGQTLSSELYCTQRKIVWPLSDVQTKKL